LESLENLLEEGGQLGSGRHAKIAPRGTLPLAFVYHQVTRGEALGGFSLKEEARPSEADWVGAAASTPLFFLKTRLEQVSSSSKVVASTTPMRGIRGASTRFELRGYLS